MEVGSETSSLTLFLKIPRWINNNLNSFVLSPQAIQLPQFLGRAAASMMPHPRNGDSEHL
jgi:hypothetical protein